MQRRLVYWLVALALAVVLTFLLPMLAGWTF